MQYLNPCYEIMLGTFVKEPMLGSSFPLVYQDQNLDSTIENTHTLA